MRLAALATRQRRPVGRTSGSPRPRRRPGILAAWCCILAGLAVLGWVSTSLGWLTLVLALAYLIALMPLLPFILRERRR